ncbi:hypothetical protein ORJ04_20090 [Rheinheimera baltica]|uniref:Uncharacterized protein n=1 Tax=Rheinheimera baltica TaxID=67576 RepID=A0ABT9I4E2_9GAMM|nr:hypothetical protein [Rheinheimera baltica]MDP5138253.1 hypothetical protein [Rheinheimera baltica]MDP5148610.1 hypothetical protein [Rheinheimera baltica]
MEGNTYYCDWGKKRSQFTVWLVDNEAIIGSGSNLSEAEEELYEQICLTYGDGEAIVEYIRALPDSEFPREFASPFYYCVSPDVWIPMLSELTDLYDSGGCPVCGHSEAGRNSNPIVVEEFPPYGDMLMLIKGRFGEDPTLNAVVVSERLAKLLNLAEHFTLREVAARTKSRKKYLEVIPHQAGQTVAAVAVKDIAQRMGEDWSGTCDECGHSRAYYYARGKLTYVVPHSEINHQKIFIIENNLAIKSVVWRKVADSVKLKGVSANQLGIAAEKDINRSPEPKYHYAKRE